MAKTITTRYDVAEHLKTPEKMVAYLEACFEEANIDILTFRFFLSHHIGKLPILAGKAIAKSG